MTEPLKKKTYLKLTRPVMLGIVAVWGLSLAVSMAGGCKKKSGPPPGPEVSIVTLQQETVPIKTELPGRTSAYLVAEIRPQVNGLIQKRLFTEGTDVKEGQLLYQIDPASFEAALNNAKGSLARAEAGLLAIKLRTERYSGLLSSNAVSKQDLDDASAATKQAQAEIEVWKAAVETAKINLEYTKVKAPISGRIGKSNVTDGDIVTAYQPLELATIQQLNPIYVDISQSTSELLKMKRRFSQTAKATDQTKKVEVLLEDGSPYPLEGAMQFKDITVDQSTGSVTLRALFPNPDYMLLPGMFVRAVITEGVNENALLVPQQAVARNPKGEPYAMVVDKENKAEQRMLVLDRAIRDQWLVLSGLNAGDRVIVEGLQKVRPGSPVRTVPFGENKIESEPPTR